MGPGVWGEWNGERTTDAVESLLVNADVSILAFVWAASFLVVSEERRQRVHAGSSDSVSTSTACASGVRSGSGTHCGPWRQVGAGSFNRHFFLLEALWHATGAISSWCNLATGRLVPRCDRASRFRPPIDVGVSIAAPGAGPQV
jgi:hypothetical protein